MNLKEFHPKIAKLIDQGYISLTNAMIMAKLPIDDQPQFIASATFCTSQFFETLIKGHLSEKEKFKELDESIKDLKDWGKTLKELYPSDNLKKPYIPENWIDDKLSIPEKNILLIVNYNNISHWALISLNKLNYDMNGLIDINELNGCSLDDEKTPDDLKDTIIILTQRLGLMNNDQGIEADLKKYLNPCPPFHVDDICHISL